MIVFLGDVALISGNLTSQYKPAYPYVFNLEYVIGKKSAYIPTKNKINLCSEKSDFEEIFGTNPAAVSVANNHIMDYQSEGYEHTISSITQKGIQIIGNAPCYILDNVCLLSYMELGANCKFSVNKETFATIVNTERAKNPNVRIIVQIHWGIENHPKQSTLQIELAHWMIDQGVDLIIGHHPHCIQPVEKYKEKYIFYSLGNALFGDINQPSHYDENGVPCRVYRFKWQKWNRKSLAVTYDEITNAVVNVEELYQSKNILHSTKKITALNKITRIYTRGFPKIKYILRKYWLFFASNSFVDGKVFDFNALSCEVKKNA